MTVKTNVWLSTIVLAVKPDIMFLKECSYHAYSDMLVPQYDTFTFSEGAQVFILQFRCIMMWLSDLEVETSDTYTNTADNMTQSVRMFSN